MKLLGRALCSLVVFVAVLVSVSSLSANGLDWSGPADLFDNVFVLLRSQRQGAQYMREFSLAEERIRMKEQVAEELREGKMTLFEAAAWFRSFYEHSRSWCDPRGPRPAWTDGERWCRLAIEWAVNKAALEREASEADALRQRLEDELQHHLRYHRTVELPN